MLCGHCGQPNPDESRFCAQCGGVLTQSTGTPPQIVDSPDTAALADHSALGSQTPINSLSSPTASHKSKGPSKAVIIGACIVAALTLLIISVTYNRSSAVSKSDTGTEAKPIVDEGTLYPYELLRNPYSHKNHIVALNAEAWPMLLNGQLLQYNDAGPNAVSIGYSGLRFKKMLDEQTALYDLMGMNAQGSSDLEMLGQLAVQGSPSGELDVKRMWDVEPLGTLEGTNALGGTVTVPAVKFWGYSDQRIVSHNNQPNAQPTQSTSSTPSSAGSGASPTWTDPQTGLTWAEKDNGGGAGGVDWDQARHYCRSLKLGGYRGWRLATIDELAGIYDQTQNVNGAHIKGNIQLSVWGVWSNTGGTASRKTLFFTFNNGERGSVDLGNGEGINGSALCVHDAEPVPSSSQTRGITSASARTAPPNAPGKPRLPTWTDQQTGLMWTKQDNGSDVNWKQASVYCQNMTLGGYSNWRLPTIEELEGIYDPTQSESGRHVKGKIQLSMGGARSNTAGSDSGEAWGFNFAYGKRVSLKLGYSGNWRALCVRRPGN